MSEPILRGHDIVCLSSIDWQFIWQGHQEIMSALAANGNRVLFVENTGVRRPALRDLPRMGQRLRNWWRGTNGFRLERHNLFVFSPVILPFPYSRTARAINRVLLRRSLRRWMSAARFGRPIVWTFLPTPLIRDVIAELDPILTIYYCIDDLASSSRAAARIAKSEVQLFSESELVFVTSEALRQRALQHTTRVHLFPFAVSFRKFEKVRTSDVAVPEDLATIPRPIAGYVGGVHQWVDLPLLAGVARAMPDTSFVLIGPLQTDVSTLQGIPNVHLLGQQPHEQVPRYLKGFDVGLVPYRLTEYTVNVYPTKLNEYLAMGLPVVATDLPEIRRFNAEYGHPIVVARDEGDFVRAVRDALCPPEPGTFDKRIAIARENSWSGRLAEMSALIEGVIAGRDPERAWEIRLRRLYRVARRRLVAAMAALALLYVLLFETDLAWWLARPLQQFDPPARADAIVVFGGGVGESGQAGGGAVQERVKHAIDLYGQHFAPVMVFSSGYEFAFKEAQIMREVAKSEGVPESAIVLETHAANTYQNVEFTRDILRARHWRRILLVSSPYHMRRALLTWRKIAPDIEVLAEPVGQSQFYTHERGASLEQLRGLVHECLAIAYYWWKGWI